MENRHYFADAPLVYTFCEGWEHVNDEHLQMHPGGFTTTVYIK